MKFKKIAVKIGECDHSNKERELNKIIWFANRELNRIKGVDK